MICNQLGLHARAASQVVSTSLKYASDINLTVIESSVQANCKSIMGLMMLAAGPGSIIEVHVKGDDAELAMESIFTLIKNRFDEE